MSDFCSECGADVGHGDRCSVPLADLRRRLASAEAQLVAMRTALRACVLWMKPGGMRGTVERDAAREAGEAALAQSHGTEALREFGLRVVAEVTRGCSHDCYRRESDVELVDAVLAGGAR